MNNLTLPQLAVLTTITHSMLIREVASLAESEFGVTNIVARDCCYHLRELGLLSNDGDKLAPTQKGLRLAMSTLEALNNSRIKFTSGLRLRGLL